MRLSVLQLNMNGDNYWDTLASFLTKHDFDVIQLQEVCGKETVVGNLNTKIDCFEALKHLLKKTHKGELAITQRYESSPSGYLANATFYKKDFPLVDINILTLHNNPKPFPKNLMDFKIVGRKLLHVTLQIDRKIISFLNTHFAWAPTPQELPHQTEQGKLLINYLKTVQQPFVMTGDFNMDHDQPTIKEISQMARNLSVEHHIKSTLNLRNHYGAENMEGLDIAVDYIFTSPAMVVKNFTLIDEDLSDHFGLTAEIEI